MKIGIATQDLRPDAHRYIEIDTNNAEPFGIFRILKARGDIDVTYNIGYDYTSVMIYPNH
ncbi:hypothetical protein SK128_020735, partial [Halocaridina rubra]